MLHSQGARVGGVGQRRLRLGPRHARELRQELRSSLANQLRQFLLVIGKVEERAARGKLLTLEQHRRPGRQQQQGGHPPVAARTGQLVDAQTAGRVGDLVVVLNEVDETARVEVETRRPAPVLLPLVALPLVEITPLDHRDEFLWISQVVGVVRLVVAGQGHHCAMMEVVVPQGIKAVAAAVEGPHESALLRLVLGDQQRRAAVRRLPHASRNCRQDVLR